MDNFISKDDQIREELRRQYMIESGNIELTPDRECEMEEFIEFNLFITKEADKVNYNKMLNKNIG